MIFLRKVFLVFPVLAGGLALGQARADAPGEVRFGVHVRPILSHNCMQCHGPDENHRKAKLRLDVESGLFGGSGDERIVVPGKPAESELWRRITAKEDYEVMPPPEAKLGRLSAAEFC